MSTPSGRKIKSINAGGTHGLRPDAGAAAKNAETPVIGTASMAARGTAQADAPRGPFKILTIPQSWYDSLHADHGADNGSGDDSGKDE